MWVRKTSNGNAADTIAVWNRARSRSNTSWKTGLPPNSECGLVLVSESVALGKMAEVGQILEDK